MADDLERYQKRVAELEAENRQLQRQLAETQTTHQQTIQELQQVRQQLHNVQTRPSEQAWRLVLDHMPEAAFWKDRNSVYLGCNRQFSQAAGLDSPEEIIGKTDFDLPWKPEETKWFRQCDLQVMESDTPELGIIEPIRQADGRQSWLQTNKIPLHDAKGSVVGILGTFMEITARIEAENQLKQLNEELERRVDERTQELQTSQARLQRLATNLPGLIFQFRLAADGTRSFPYVSEGCRDIHELEPDDFLRCFDLVHDRDRDALEQAIQVSALTLSGFHHEHRIITPSGQLKWVQTIARPEHKPDDAIVWDGLIIEVSDRKQAEKEQRRLLSILEATPDIVGIWDAQGNHLYLNQAGQTLLEIAPEDLQQASIQFCHPAKTLKKIEAEALPTAIQTGMWQGESYLRSQSGRDFPVSQVILAHRDEDGNLEFLSSVMRDISDLKAAEQAVQESEVKYQQILDSITDMVLVKREKSHIVWANQAFRDYYGINQDLPNQINVGFDPPDYTKRYTRDDAHVFTSGQPIEIEEPVTRHDGEVRQFNTIKSAIRNSQGDIILTVGVSRDITDRKRAEERLRQQEAQYRQIFETVTDGLGILNLETGKLLEANPACYQMHGYSYQEFLTHSPETYVHPDSRHIYQQLMTAVQAGHTYSAHATNIHRDGTLIELDIKGIPFLYQGRPHALCILRDITQRLQLEAERKRQEQALHAIVKGTAAQTGEAFFQACVKHLALALGVRYALIAEVIDVGDHLLGRTVAFWNDTDLGDNFEYNLVGTPCANIVQTHAVCRYSHSVQKHFPDDKELANLNAESYVGIPILGPSDQFLGYISVINTEPMEAGVEMQVFILEIFAARVGAEIKRMQVEKALIASNQKIQQQAQREQLLNQIANQIRTSLNLDFIINTAVREIQAFLGVDRCHFAWYVETHDQTYWDVIAEVQAPHLPSFIGRYTATIFGSLTDRILDQQILRLDDIDTIHDAEVQRILTGLGNKSMLVLPVKAESGQVGIISCLHSQGIRPWLTDEVKLLKSVVAQLEIALNQADLLTQTEARAQELEVLLNQLQRAQSQLVQSEKMSSLGQMVAGVAHEINNPVNFIYGNLTHAKNYTHDLVHLIESYQYHYPQTPADIQAMMDEVELDFLKEDLPKLFQSMEVGTERIREIIKSLRLFSRLDEAEIKQVDLHDGLDSTLTILKTRLRAQHWRPDIQVVKDYGELPQIECHAGQLNQVFMNLLSNAVDALEERDQQRTWQQMEHEPSTIVIRTQFLSQLNQPAIAIAITDNGPGISQNASEYLFNPFFTTKPVGKGTGLGLSISYQIITETHSGTIGYDSVPGQGTTFTITLPIKQ
ncbi:multi-sensor signal transduction histidine kinase [Leptolyngbya sp. Heron Island J]|uniref:PAS domain S-box protein n=1 Tax=Leptolyngbya sp. Heron Island J TaxID=1385935 RepID=UPI0003B9D163|nr:PAS domain S-box protein [Leptolyngbya sp. Heron Island J]ESA36904.1 multi-sensor signal transduction histidine kinase [Leptolyngbya sp. Heron Island J]